MDGQRWLDDAGREFKRLRAVAEKALEQVGDEDFFRAPDEVSNSVAIIVKHVGGNLRSRWRDFLTTDGEKSDRDRDGEFEVRHGDTRSSIEEFWAAGWKHLEDALASIDPLDVERTVTIRGQPHTIVQAVQRQLSHYSWHIGQLVYVARMWAGREWKSLSIPKGESKIFNERPENHIDNESKP